MSENRFSKWVLSASAVIAVVLIAVPVAAPSAEKKGTVRIAEGDWTGNLVDINLAKIILEEEMGYEVELAYVDYTAQWVSIQAGDLDVSMELWTDTTRAQKAKYLKEFGGDGSITYIGPLGVIGKGGWYVPTYVIEGDPERGIEPMCPEIANDWRALNECKDLFATVETAPQGRWVGCYVIGWQCHEEERVKNLGLDFQQAYMGSEAAAVAEWDGAYSRGEAIVMHMWVPHWMHAVYDMTPLTLPEYSDECWGLVEDVEPTYACDFGPSVTYIIGNPDFVRKNPEVVEFFGNFQLTNEQQAELLRGVDYDERSVEDVVREWLVGNRDIWSAWIPKGY